MSSSFGLWKIFYKTAVLILLPIVLTSHIKRMKQNRRPAFGAAKIRRNTLTTLDKKRKAKELNAFKKAKVLQKYSKLVEREGVVSSRVNIGKGKKPKSETRNDDTDQEDDIGSGGDEVAKSKNKNRKGDVKGKKKLNPFKKAEQEASVRQTAKQEREDGFRQRNEEVAHKLKKREETRKKLQKRTKKGQPVMKFQIQNLYEKLQKQKT